MLVFRPTPSRERGRRILWKPSLPKRVASNRRDHAKIVSPAQRRGGQKTSIFERNYRQKRRPYSARRQVVRWAGNPLADPGSARRPGKNRTAVTVRPVGPKIQGPAQPP